MQTTITRLWWPFIAVHVIAIGLVEALNPYWPIWLERWISPDHWLYPMTLACVYGLPILSSAYTAPLWGKFTDRIGAIVNWARAVSGLGLILLSLTWVPSILMLLLVRIFQGLIASVLPASQHVALSLDPHNGLYRLQSATSIAGVLGPIAFGCLLLYLSVNNTLSVLGGCLVVIGGLTIGFVRSENHSKIEKSYKLLKVKNYHVPSLTFGMLSAARWMVIPVLASLTASMPIESSFMSVPSSMGLAVIYSVLPFGILVSKPIWNIVAMQPVKWISASLLMASMLTLLQCFATEYWQLMIIRFFIGVFLSPLMPWTQTQMLALKMSIDHNVQRGFIMGGIQKQQRMGMLVGLMCGSMIVWHKELAIILSALLYFLLFLQFKICNRRSVKLLSTEYTEG